MLFIKAFLTRNDLGDLIAGIQRDLTYHKSKYVIRGIIFIVVGILAALLSAITSLRGEQIIASLLLLIGALHFFLAFKSKIYGWSLFASLVLIVIGVAVLWQPAPLVIVLLKAIAILTAIEGLLEMVLAFRGHPIHYWGWILFAGFITLTFATIMWMSISTFDAAHLIQVIATSLVFYGLLLLMMVWQTKY